MKKKVFASLAILIAFSVAICTGFTYTDVNAKTKRDTPREGVVYLNEHPVKVNEVIYATPENQEELVKKYGLKKPSATAKLRSIRVIDKPSEDDEKQKNEDKTKASALGYRFEKDLPQNIDGSEEIARGKYFCNKTKGSCKAEIALSANESVKVELHATFGATYNDEVSAEFGYSVGDTVGVSTTVNVQNDTIPAKKTWIVVGYPVYKATFFKFYYDGIWGSDDLGSGTYMLPKKSSLAVTDWIQS